MALTPALPAVPEPGAPAQAAPAGGPPAGAGPGKQQLQAASAATPTLFAPLLERSSAPPGGGRRAKGARTAQSEGADTETLEQVAAAVAAALLGQAPLPVPSAGAPTHTDDAAETGPETHGAPAAAGAAAGLAGLAGPALLAAGTAPQPPKPQLAAASAGRLLATADGTGAPPHAARTGGTAAAGSSPVAPAGSRGHAETATRPAIAAAAPAPASAPAVRPAQAAAAAVAPPARPARPLPPAAPGRARAAAVAVAAARIDAVAGAAGPAATGPQAPPQATRSRSNDSGSGSGLSAAAALRQAIEGAFGGQQAAATSTAPTPAGLPAQPTVHTRPGELPPAATAVVQVAVAARATRARIVLTPPELGRIEIRLRYGTNGVSATLRPDSPAAARQLQLAADDLRRSLESQGITVQQIAVPAPVQGAGGGAPAAAAQQLPQPPQPGPAAQGFQPAGGFGGGGSSAADQPPARGDGRSGRGTGSRQFFEPDDPRAVRTVLLGTAVDVLA